MSPLLLNLTDVLYVKLQQNTCRREEDWRFERDVSVQTIHTFIH
ncbi:hypothetical protein CSUI_007283 [Cystoisospora suis]|uniref:Uncharacterized protein n=1 Tax=Cystoisospora suis TaxID=483139 RepID=A0A2C6KMX2_9APIC|nr:hypothetical protein CSUI_007283 [Cystoisospora suis]